MGTNCKHFGKAIVHTDVFIHKLRGTAKQEAGQVTNDKACEEH